MIQESPAFDSTRRALVFAFNATDASIPAPMMVRMMAEIQASPRTPKVEQMARKRGPGPNPGEMLRGLNKAMQAGFILQQVARLNPEHQNALAARLTRFSEPCLCGSLCCQGYRVNFRWAQAINTLCEAAKETGDVLKIPGKKGLSTEPRLRRLIVERFFRADASNWSIAQMARQGEVSAITAARHSEWINAWLTQVEGEAWSQIDAIFDQTGVTGLIT